MALRRGYGATGGDWAEGISHKPGDDYVRPGLETARDIAATVNYATAGRGRDWPLRRRLGHDRLQLDPALPRDGPCQHGRRTRAERDKRRGLAAGTRSL